MNEKRNYYFEVGDWFIGLFRCNVSYFKENPFPKRVEVSESDRVEPKTNGDTDGSIEARDGELQQ